MSNKTTLQSNNTNLASCTDRVTALINVVNELPDAGGGSAYYAKGTLTTSSDLKTNGTVFFNVNDLPFKPVYVIVRLLTPFISMTSTAYYGLMSLESGLANKGTFAKRYNSSYTYGYSSTAYAIIIINNDGFTVRSLNDYLYVGETYEYIAIGGQLNYVDGEDSGSGEDGSGGTGREDPDEVSPDF